MSTLPAAPLPHRALYEEVAEQLRQRIFARGLEPGAWIDEQRIAAEYGISRTPLREALKVLAAEGLVTMKLRRGAYVTEMSERDVREAYQLLALLESDAAAAVARSASQADLDALLAMHELLKSSLGDRQAFFAANEHFHLRLLEMEGNRWRLNIVRDLRRLMKLNRHHSLFQEGRIERSLAEHEEFVQALLLRDAERCRQLWLLHFANGLRATEGAEHTN